MTARPLFFTRPPIAETIKKKSNALATGVTRDGREGGTAGREGGQ